MSWSFFEKMNFSVLEQQTQKCNIMLVNKQKRHHEKKTNKINQISRSAKIFLSSAD